MKDLYTYLEEFATPANTIGMGNPMPPLDGQVGSEPMVTAKCKKAKKKKSLFNACHDGDQPCPLRKSKL